MRLDLGEGQDAAVDLELGEQVEIVVPHRAATGYLWDVGLDEERCRLISRHAAGPDRGSFGGEQLETIVLEPTEQGTTTVALKLGRPWEAQPLQTLAVELRVRERATDG
jgi:predicted secreted protein